MNRDPKDIAVAIGLLNAAQQHLAALRESTVLSPDGRERIAMIVGRLGLEADVLRGGDEPGLVRRALTQQERAAFFRETFPRQMGATK